MSFVFFLLMVIGLAGSSASSSEKMDYPKQVVDEIRELEWECTEEGGSRGASDSPPKNFSYKTPLSIIRFSDLTGDGINDYYFADKDVFCQMGLTNRHGSRGGQALIIFLGQKNNAAKKIFEQTVWETDFTNRIRVIVAGSYCTTIPIPEDTPMSDIPTCKRYVEWNDLNKKFEFTEK